MNSAFCDLTGYAEADIVGRNCRFLAGESTEPWVTSQIRDAIRDRRPVLADILNYRRDGTAFRNGVMITPLFDPEGGLAWFLGSQVDLGEPSADRLSDDRRERRGSWPTSRLASTRCSSSWRAASSTSRSRGS